VAGLKRLRSSEEAARLRGKQAGELGA
jgi:hypothetical protein